MWVTPNAAESKSGGTNNSRGGPEASMVSPESHILNLGLSTKDLESTEEIHWGLTETRKEWHGIQT